MTPAPTRPTALSPPLPPLHPQLRLYFLPAFKAPSFHTSLQSDDTANGPGLRLGRCLAHLVTLGGLPRGQGPPPPPSAAGLGVPGRWAPTTHPLGAHRSRETVRRFQARAKGRLSVRGPRRPLSARHAVRFSGSLSVRGPPAPLSLLPGPPSNPHPASFSGPRGWSLMGVTPPSPAGATRRAGAAALGCERIKPAGAEPPAGAYGLSGVFQRFLCPGALLQTGLGAPASRFQESFEKVDLRCIGEWCQLPQPSYPSRRLALHSLAHSALPASSAP